MLMRLQVVVKKLDAIESLGCPCLIYPTCTLKLEIVASIGFC